MPEPLCGPVESTTDAPAMLRVRLDLAYDGTDFHGWAAQPGLRTVQGVLEGAIEKIVRRPVRTVVAGRTDAGVHARGQVVHLDLTTAEWQGLPRGRPDLDPAATLVRRLAGVLGREDGDLFVHRAQAAPEGFDARFSALSRSYSYTISDDPITRDPLSRRSTYWHSAPLQTETMHREAAAMLGLHDFLTYCKPRDGATTIRELQRFTVERDDRGLVVARLQADAFCHNMVRALMGALIQVGEGRQEPGWMAHRLAQQVRDSEIRLAPPHALVLERVDYPDDGQAPGALAARAEGTRARRAPLG